MDAFDFDPLRNPEDRAKLTKSLEDIWIDIYTKLKKDRGEITIGDKTYKFFGYGPWLSPWETWYMRKMTEINNDVRGYSKADRWDDLGILIAKYSQLIEQDLPSSKNLVKEFLMIMEKEDKPPQNPEDVAKKETEIYKVIKDKVLSRLIPGMELDDKMVPIIWDKIREHVMMEEKMAINFLEFSGDISGILSNTLQKLQTKPPPDT